MTFFDNCLVTMSLQPRYETCISNEKLHLTWPYFGFMQNGIWIRTSMKTNKISFFVRAILIQFTDIFIRLGKIVIDPKW